MSIEFEGLDEIVERLDKMASAETIRECLKDSCLAVEESARKHAPKGDGALARSITSEVNGFVGEVFTPLEYAPYVEYGTGLFAEDGGRTDVPWRYQADDGKWYSTSGMHPQPYMRPALEENRSEIIEIFKEAITQK